MGKYLIVLGLLAASLGLLNWISNPQPGEHQTSATPTPVIQTPMSQPQVQTAAPPQMIKTSSSEVSVKKPVIQTSNLRPGELFDYLASDRFKQNLETDNSLLADLTLRFSRPYADDPQDELTSRIGILRAIARVTRQGIGPQTKESLRVLSQQVLNNPNENWVVKREALRGMAGLGWSGSETARSNTFAQLDPRVIAAAQMSDDEFFEKMGRKE